MLQTVRLITLFSSVAAVCFFFLRYKHIKYNALFFLFCFELCLNESLMFITAEFGIKNHIIANINTLIYFSLAVFVLFKVWESVKGKNKLIVWIKYIIITLIVVGWFLENFILASISFYNSLLSSIISLLLVIMSVYLINVILFIKNSSILKDSNGLLLIGILIRSFSCGLILLFMNYRMNYSPDFYSNILILVNLALIISNIFFLFAIICLPKNRKYTWPF